MRSMTVFNYLLEATVFGSVLCLLAVAVRMLLREKIGNRAVYALWLPVALRLLLPLSLPNPLMDEFRPGFSTDVAARPVADQVRQRLIDVGTALSGDGGHTLEKLTQQMRGGETGRWVLALWLVIAALVAAWLWMRQARFVRRVRKNRVRELDGEMLETYRKLCERYHVKPIPVYWVDHLPAACLVSAPLFEKPFIGLPLDAPKEHVALLLAHQLCHRKGRDHWWGVVRGLCCAVHWFNPIVWMAAWLSYRDSEMACDSRVIAKLADMDRLAYANVIVSAGERENAANMGVTVGASFTDGHLRQRVTSVIRFGRFSRVGLALGAIAAAVVLALSFATGESEPLPTVAMVPAVEWSAAAQPIGADMEAIAAARRFLESPFVGEDSARYAFTARRNGTEWLVEARNASYERPVAFAFSQEGRLLEYDGSALLGGLTFADTTYTHRTLTPSVQSYLDAFVHALVPEVHYQQSEALADVRAGDVRVLLGELRQEDGTCTCRFSLQVEPTPRILRAVPERSQ